MRLIIGILLIPIGIYLIYKGIREAKEEFKSGWARNSINLILFAIGVILVGVNLIFNYLKK